MVLKRYCSNSCEERKVTRHLVGLQFVVCKNSSSSLEKIEESVTG